MANGGAAIDGHWAHRQCRGDGECGPSRRRSRIGRGRVIPADIGPPRSKRLVRRIWSRSRCRANQGIRCLANEERTIPLASASPSRRCRSAARKSCPVSQSEFVAFHAFCSVGVIGRWWQSITNGLYQSWAGPFRIPDHTFVFEGLNHVMTVHPSGSSRWAAWRRGCRWLLAGARQRRHGRVSRRVPADGANVPAQVVDPRS